MMKDVPDQHDAASVDVNAEHHQNDPRDFDDDGVGYDVLVEVVPHQAGFHRWASDRFVCAAAVAQV